LAETFLISGRADGLRAGSLPMSQGKNHNITTSFKKECLGQVRLGDDGIIDATLIANWL